MVKWGVTCERRVPQTLRFAASATITFTVAYINQIRVLQIVASHHQRIHHFPSIYLYVLDVYLRIIIGE